ncbi:MAG: hypothetical protein H6659_11590 [Ardenticatenaceae bacterium]|nr:hypothetical protein [Ardenticatenaceae bacterium]
MTTTTSKPYRVFIVRWWENQHTSTDNSSRFVLEIPGTGERYGFTSADMLLHALKNQLDTAVLPLNPSAQPAEEETL